jgi:DNA-binding NarL/FixJ family response regulator
VERGLSRDGFEIRGVETMAALAAAAVGFPADIVLVDVNLPGVDPVQAVALARDLARGAQIVLYSAWEESRLRDLARRAGADGYLSKGESVLAIGPKLRALRALRGPQTTPAAPR